MNKSTHHSNSNKKVSFIKRIRPEYWVAIVAVLVVGVGAVAGEYLYPSTKPQTQESAAVRRDDPANCGKEGCECGCNQKGTCKLNCAGMHTNAGNESACPGVWCSAVVESDGSRVPGFCNSTGSTCGNRAAELGYRVILEPSPAGAAQGVYGGIYQCQMGKKGKNGVVYTGGGCGIDNGWPLNYMPNCFCGVIQQDYTTGGHSTIANGCGCDGGGGEGGGVSTTFPVPTLPPNVPPPPTWTPIPTPPPFVCDRKLDIAISIDRSGTMNQSYQGRKKLLWAKEAAQIFVDELIKADVNKLARVSINSFGGQGNDGTGKLEDGRNSTLHTPLTADMEAVKTGLLGVNHEMNYTCIECGIKIANQELAVSTPDTTKVAILLSDGMSNHNWDGSTGRSNPNAIARSDEGRAMGLFYKVLGYGEKLPGKINEDTLKRIACQVPEDASCVANNYVHTPDPAMWAADFVKILQNICAGPSAPTLAPMSPVPTKKPANTPRPTKVSGKTPTPVINLGSCTNYAIDEFSGTDSQLVSVNSSLNAVSLIKTYPCKTGPCDFESLETTGGVLYGISNTRKTLYRINPANGNLDTGVKLNPALNITGLSVKKTDGTIWAWAPGKGLYTLNPSTGALTRVKASSLATVEDIAWDNAGKFLYMTKSPGNELHRYNSSNGSITKHATLPGKTDGIDFPPASYASGHMIGAYRGSGGASSKYVTMYLYDVNAKKVVRKIQANTNHSNIDALTVCH